MAKDKLPAARHLQSVVEWRYPKAHRYWDDCGKLVAAIETAFPGLLCQGLDDKGFRFEGLSRGVNSALFFWDRASLTQAGQGDDSLAVAAQNYWSLVRQGLGISAADRIGHRTWLCFETDRPTDAERWLQRHALWAFDRDANTIGAPQASGSVLRTRLEEDSRKVRLEVNSGSIAIKGNTNRDFHGVIADVDIVVEPPGLVSDELSDFVKWNIKFLRTKVDSLFR